CRNFSEKGIPLRSQIGNKITRSTFKFFCGIKVSDTQTGLRGMDKPLIKRFIKTKGNRFEYEMNMLMDAKASNISILQIPISTIYIDGNETSKFSVLKDSMRVYRVFLKFMLISLTSLLIDSLLFMFVLWVCDSNFAFLSQTIVVFIATITARVFSSLFNYTFNKKAVFNSKNAKHTFIKYYVLCGIQMLLSATLVNVLANFLNLFKILIKFIADTFLFFVSFSLQREWVFKKN
ncbi:MAG: GtrA family protein, partial [Oscillospiraceae bacterium]